MATSSISPDFAAHRASYLKTTLSALTSGLFLLVMLCVLSLRVVQAPLGRAAVAIVGVVLGLLFLLCALVTWSGLVVLYRHARDGRNEADLFYRHFSREPAVATRGWRRWTRPMFGSALRPGDLVRVRAAGEILATLDASGKLNGLPFMPEMLGHCGQPMRVDRRIDKINDWMGGNELRRTKGIVTLVDARCSGVAHGGCHAACQILWNERWLSRVTAGQSDAQAAQANGQGPVDEAASSRALEAMLAKAAVQQTQRDGRMIDRYTCQITELVRASVPMSRWDVRQDLRPVWNGNLSIVGYLVAMLTGLFNEVQELRRGVEYPITAPQLDRGPTPLEKLNLDPGELVQVRSKHEIGLTLHKNHNRGMWFGKETLRFCNQRYTVRSRVERIIHERSGEMVALHTPGVILDGVCGSGEFLRLCPQNEYVFWREIWLKRVDDATADDGDGAKLIQG